MAQCPFEDIHDVDAGQNENEFDIPSLLVIMYYGHLKKFTLQISQYQNYSCPVLLPELGRGGGGWSHSKLNRADAEGGKGRVIGKT